MLTTTVLSQEMDTVESDKVFLTVVSAYAETPTVSAGGNLSVMTGEIFTLSITASVNDGGTLSYQWSRGTANSPSAAVPLTDETEPVYSGLAPTTPDLYFYFCTVTNTINGASARAIVTYAVIVQENSGGGGGGGGGGSGGGVEPPYVFPFTDVTIGKWYYFDVLIAHHNGLINGTTSTTFLSEKIFSIRFLWRHL